MTDEIKNKKPAFYTTESARIASGDFTHTDAVTLIGWCAISFAVIRLTANTQGFSSVIGPVVIATLFFIAAVARLVRWFKGDRRAKWLRREAHGRSLLRRGDTLEERWATLTCECLIATSVADTEARLVNIRSALREQVNLHNDQERFCNRGPTFEERPGSGF